MYDSLARSDSDHTPAVGHVVLNKHSLDRACTFKCTHKIVPRPVVADRQILKLIVPSPEDPFKTRNVIVEIIYLDQFLSSEDEKSLPKGYNDMDPKQLNQLQFFGNDNIRSDVDYTVLRGRFSKEDKLLPDKMLIVRPSSMVTNVDLDWKEKDSMANSIYSALRGCCGKRGFEMRRTCGSSGNISHGSDRDLLTVLHEHEGSLPRKVHGSIIIRGSDRYHILYRKVNPQPGASLYACTHYSPPKDGGAFVMPSICMSKYEMLADMCYNKMMCVLFVDELNKALMPAGVLPIAAGPIMCEKRKILQAREGAKELPDNTRMHHLLSKYNSLNGFSMVAYPVGHHYDNYYRDLNREYVENKALFAIKPQKKSIGRGGSIRGNMYVFGVMDW